ncbi:MAG: hypothetical protein F7C33_03775 [Desulfurococcales archaeon]|nr:hypothetical protein [Desulfurococcales archaeon]
MAISTLHHVLPDVPPPHPQTHSVVQPSSTTALATITNGSSLTTTTSPLIHYTSSTISSMALIFLISFIIIILIVAVLAVKSSPALLGEIRREPGRMVEAGTPYKYTGLRRRLRQLYLAVRAKAESTVGIALRSKTAMEIARITGMYREFAMEYTKAMYGPGLLDKETVSRIERLARNEA